MVGGDQIPVLLVYGAQATWNCLLSLGGANEVGDAESGHLGSNSAIAQPSDIFYVTVSRLLLFCV